MSNDQRAIFFFVIGILRTQSASFDSARSHIIAPKKRPFDPKAPPSLRHSRRSLTSFCLCESDQRHTQADRIYWCLRAGDLKEMHICASLLGLFVFPILFFLGNRSAGKAESYPDSNRFSLYLLNLYSYTYSVVFPYNACILFSFCVAKREGRETEGFESPHIDAQSIRIIGQACISTRNPFFAGCTKLRIYIDIYTQETRNK